MKTAKEYVDAINAAGVFSPHFIDDEVDMDGVECVAIVDQDEHRWYVNGTKVFRVGDEFFGVHGPVSLKSEEMGYRDIEWQCQAFEMEEAPSVTYKEKKNAE